MIFFTSDTHFGHENIIKYCARPFASVEEMDAEIIKRWNATVSKTDIVYHLGDFAFGRKGTREYAQSVLLQLNGRIHLILGNHDQEERLPQGFESIETFREIEVDGQKIVLFHYGMRTWRHDLRGTWHLYGHSHGGLAPYGKSCDVGVDSWEFAPVEFSELKKYMGVLPIGNHPVFKDFVVGTPNV